MYQEVFFKNCHCSSKVLNMTGMKWGENKKEKANKRDKETKEKQQKKHKKIKNKI